MVQLAPGSRISPHEDENEIFGTLQMLGWTPPGEGSKEPESRTHASCLGGVHPPGLAAICGQPKHKNQTTNGFGEHLRKFNFRDCEMRTLLDEVAMNKTFGNHMRFPRRT